MPERPLFEAWWLFIVAGVVIGLMIGSCPGTGTDADLGRTAREAVQMAHEAQKSDRSAVLWAGRFRLIAVIIGVTVPLVIAYLLWRSSNTGEPDAAEIIHAAQQYLSDDGPHALPGSSAPATCAREPPSCDLVATTHRPTTDTPNVTTPPNE